MDSPDDILNSYQAMADSAAKARPLIDANDFNDPAMHGHPVSNQPGMNYLGCCALWLSMRGGLRETELLQPPFPLPATPDLFARTVIGPQLWARHIREDLSAFVDAYVRETSLYGNDYQDLVVGLNNLVDMTQVDDVVVTFVPLWTRMMERFALFIQGDAKWTARSPRPVVELATAERTSPGWEHAFLQAIEMDNLPHRQREFAISRFFALVDLAHGSHSPAVARTLLTSFRPGADASLQEAVLRALYSMPFETVWHAIVEDAQRISEAGWLADVMSLWANDYTDEQQELLCNEYAKLPETTRILMHAAASHEGHSGDPWAVKLRELDGRDPRAA